MINIKKCRCGGIKFTINIVSGDIICNKCFMAVCSDTIKPPQKKVYCYGEDRKMRARWSVLNSRGIKKGFGCCDYEEFAGWYMAVEDICHYCSGEMENISKKYGNMITIDRMDNGKGYFIGNMVKACFVCNSTKGQFFTHDQMIKIAKLVLL